MSRVLVVEDEQHLADGLRFNLEAEGYQVEHAATGEAAQELLAKGAPAFDVVILDVMLPGKDGFAVLCEMRRAGQFTPTLILTARGHPGDVLEGFEAGADDYLTKPFELRILLARIRALLRRRDWLRSSPDAPVPAVGAKDPFTFGDKSVHPESLELHVRDRVYPLTLMEANVLRYLIEHEGETVSRKKMLVDVWGLHEDTDTRPIDNFIVRLRRYIEDDPARPRHLLTVRSVGYRFVASPDRSGSD
jgi:DNA-binding response OmpR family regulator